MWLSVGPVDELADDVANIIIGDPAVNAVWIAKWQARPKELFAEPYGTLIDPRRHHRPARRDHVPGGRDPRHRGHVDHDGSRRSAGGGLPGAGPVVKVGGAHAANLTNPGPVNEAIVEFLQSIGD